MPERTGLLSYLPFAALDAVLLRNVTGRLLRLERDQWRSPAEIEAIQRRRLRRLLAYAGEHSPYYRRLFREAGVTPAGIRSLEDLEKIPVMTKETLRARAEEILAVPHEGKRLVRDATGGSTGTPTPVFYTRAHRSWRTAAAHRLYRMAGRCAFTPTVNLAGSPVDMARFRTRFERIKAALRREVRLPAFELHEEDYRRLLGTIQRFRPEVVMGYCACLRHLARVALEAGNPLSIPRVIPTSELVTAQDRALFREAFGAETFELYGSREVTGMAGECSAHAGLHASADLVRFEVVKGGRVLPPGEEGELLVTDLVNFAFPLIRYAIGDVGRLLPGPCPCGRGLPRLEITQGRVLDRIELPGGRVVPAAWFPHLFKEVWREVREYQVVQEAPAAVEVRILPTTSYTPDTERFLRERLRPVLGGETRLRITLHDRLPRERSGKFRPVKGLPDEGDHGRKEAAIPSEVHTRLIETRS